MPGISTHVLDTARGLPASGIPVRLDRHREDGGWEAVAKAVTDADGRAALMADPPASAVYRLSFDTAAHLGEDGFFPEVTVAFRASGPDRPYHVPLLLSPFGYSTYRGS